MSLGQKNILRDIGIILISVGVAIFLVKGGWLENFLHSIKGFEYLGSFITGLFFTSIFTTIPATAVLGEIAQENSAIITATLGGLGALCGDLIIFRFVKNNVSADFEYIIRSLKKEKHRLWLGDKFWNLKAVRFIIPLLGAMIIASPLPDELGLMLLGLSKIKTAALVPLSFFLNTLGIFIIALIAQNLK